MRKHLLLIASMAPVCAIAQGSAAPNGDLQRCLLHTTATTWTELELTRDQLQRMKFIQEACAEECKAAGAPGNQNPISNTDGNTVLDEVHNVLNDQQYEAWITWCAENEEW